VGKKMKILRLILFISIIGLLACCCIPVYAISSTPTILLINSVTPFENNLQVGDMAFAVDYTITYTSPPTETVTTTYNVRLMNGTTELRSASPYSFFDNGFNKGLVWIYFSASDVTNLGITWNNVNYIMRLDGNPTASWSGSIPSAPAVGSLSFQWTNASTTVGANQILLTNYILAEAQSIQNAWNSLTNYTLYTNTATNGPKLTSVGESYFAGVISGLDALVPNALQTSSQQMDLITPMATPNKYADSIANDVQGTNYSTGTAAFVQGTNTVTGTGTSWTSQMTGGLIQDTNEYAFSTIKSVDVPDQIITLTSNYVPVSNPTANYLIIYAPSPASTGSVSPLSLVAPAKALHVSETVFGVLVVAGICVFVMMHGAGAANSYRPLILICLPLLYCFTRIGWLPLGFTIGLAIFATILLFWTIFYNPSIQ
jgi:hypothetical protein